MTRADILRKIAALELKRASANDELSRYYYAMCIAGWKRMLEKAL